MTSPNPGTTLDGADGKRYHVLPDDAESAGDADFGGDFTGSYGVVYTLSAPGEDASVIIEDGAPEGSGVRVKITAAAAPPTPVTSTPVTASTATTTTASTDAHTPDAPAPQAEFMPERSA